MKQTSPRKKLTRFGLAFILLTGCGLFAFSLYPLLFPPPLNLAPGEGIKAAYLIPEGPFWIGDLIPVTLAVESRHGINYQRPELPAGRLGSLEIREQQQITTERRRGGIRQTTDYILTAWETGSFPLPPLTIYYQDAEGAEQIYELKPEKIVVTSLLPAGKTWEELSALPIKGVKEPVGLPPNWSYLFWISLVLIGAFLLWLLVRFISSHMAQKTTLQDEESALEPADHIARRRLAALKKASYLERGDLKGFYSKLSEILREYMENRFEITALEMTTEEFLTHLAAPDKLLTSSSAQQTAPILNWEQQARLATFLNAADLVKFAQHLPAAPEIEMDLKIVEQLITETKEVPATPAGTGGDGRPGEILIEQEQLT